MSYSERPAVVPGLPSDDRELANTIRELSIGPEAQELLNARFPLDRREQMLQQAPLDSKGRRVRYYRRMSYHFFLSMLEKGEQTAYDYFHPHPHKNREYRNLDDQVDTEDLFHVLNRYTHHVYGYESDETYTTEAQVKRATIGGDSAELLAVTQKLFPDVSQAEIAATFTHATFATLLPFIAKHTPLEFQRRMHSGGYAQKFSSLLSVSVGGVIGLELDQTRSDGRNASVYVEFVLPQDQPVYISKGSKGEKELFVHQLPIAAVSRVFLSNQQIINEVLTDTTSPVGEYYARHFDEENVQHFSPRLAAESVVQKWRWQEKNEDCWPVGAAAPRDEL